MGERGKGKLSNQIIRQELAGLEYAWGYAPCLN